jgi:GNAT superfamily N-acetyltransferase
VPEVRPLEREEERPAAAVLADAFIDDPGWSAVGPNSRARRLKMLRRFFRAHMAVARRWGGPMYGAFDGGGPTGALIAFAEGRFPPPPQSMLLEGPGMLAAGPATTIRALRGQAALEAGHPEEPHAFVSMLGVDPTRQRAGAGRALLGRVIAEAEARAVPVYLDTANPDNLPYYRSFGFELQGEAPLPRGATIWYLLRPVDGALASV